MTVADRAATDLAPLAGLQPGHVGLNATVLDHTVGFDRAVRRLGRADPRPGDGAPAARTPSRGFARGRRSTRAPPAIAAGTPPEG